MYQYGIEEWMAQYAGQTKQHIHKMIDQLGIR